MGLFVVDASLTLSWCFADEATPNSRSVLATLQTTYAVVPGVMAVRGFQRSRPCSAPSTHHTGRYLRFPGRTPTAPIQIERREALWLWQTVLPLAREHQLSAYDAAYLELAKRERMHLATLDHDLQKASHTLGVPTLEIP
jgi:hypothetical protein